MAWEATRFEKTYGKTLMAVVYRAEHTATDADWAWEICTSKMPRLLAGSRAISRDAAQAAADAWVTDLLDEVSNAS